MPKPNFQNLKVRCKCWSLQAYNNHSWALGVLLLCSRHLCMLSVDFRLNLSAMTL